MPALWAAILVALVVWFGLSRWSKSQVSNLREAFEKRVRSETKDRAARLEADIEAGEAEQRRRMADADYWAGRTAAKARDAEWARRQARDPELAHTAIEKAILRMAALGADVSKSPEVVLREAALLAAPAGSAARVERLGGGYELRVAFPMSAVSAEEAGAVTKHHTPQAMRREVETLCSRVIRDLFDSCGRLGLLRVQVTCNHAIRSAPGWAFLTSEETREILATSAPRMSKLYRVAMEFPEGAEMPSWRRISEAEIFRRMKVDYDGLTTLTISRGLDARRDASDPNTPLEF